MGTARFAAVQASSVFLDREATIDRVAELTAKAAGDGAQLVLFPETFVPGYPDWVWRTGPWSAAPWFARLSEQSVTVPGEAFDRLAAIAAEYEVYLCVGVNEREPNGSTIYNTLLYLGPDGAFLGRHRKLMPTGGERLVWGFGDGSTLTVFDTPFGRIGGLICWENYMPLARAAMYAQGIDVLLSPTWDNSDVWVSTLRHIAKEGRVYVVGATPCQHGSSVPTDLPRSTEMYSGDSGDWMSRGNSTIVGPTGDILAGPLVGEEGIVMAEIDLDAVRLAREEFDPVGHYARPDVFRLDVDVRAKPAVVFRNEIED